MAKIEMMSEAERRAIDEQLGASLERTGIGALASSRGNLPLKSIDVDAHIVGLVSRTSVRQTFFNNHSTPLEATYIFPLPDRAAVSSFQMRIGRRAVRGEIRERGEARRNYEEAVERGRRASIVEEDRPDVFTMRAGNIQPGESVTVELQLSAILPAADGEATFRFPLVVAPRYVPGEALGGEQSGDGVVPDTDAVPDASRISPPLLLPGFPNPVHLTLAVTIDGAADVRSSLHAIHTSGSRIELAERERLDRDFILRFRTALGASLICAPDDKGDEGTFMLTVAPPAGSAAEGRPRDVVFLLDRSGSMQGWKITAARRAVARMIDSLGGRDRFLLTLFSNGVTSPDGLSQLAPATDRNRYAATEWLARAEADGGTEMAGPLLSSLDVLSESSRDRFLVLITDGQVGNEDQILTGLRGRVRGARIFTVGIDRAVNAGFLNRLAELASGRCELVESEEQLDRALDRIHRTLQTPLASELTVNLTGVELLRSALAPSRPVDLFAGAPATIFGRYSGKGRPAAFVDGLARSGEPWRARVDAIEAREPAIRAVWAKAHIRELEDRRFLVSGGAVQELEREIIETSLEFGVLSRFTAFVALDDHIAQAGRHRVVQPVEMPSGWEDQSIVRRPRASNRATSTKAGVLRGKFMYLTPARIRGEPVTPSDDVFLLAVILCEMLTAERLFKGEHSLQTLQAIVDWDASHLAPIAAKLGVFYPVIARALAKRPGDRWPTPAAFLAALPSLPFGRAEMRAEMVCRFPSEAAPPVIRAGKAFAGYELVERVAVGGIAETWLARPRGGGAWCAVKIALESVADDHELVAVFLDEPRFDHENIVKLLETGTSPRPFIATEWVHGKPVTALLAGGPLAQGMAGYVIASAARALAYATDAFAPKVYVSASLEPGNMLIGFDGLVKLIDV